MRAIKTPAISTRPALLQDVGKMCEFAEDLLLTWDARTTAPEARRIYEHVLASPDLGIIMVAEHENAIHGFAYACYDWRTEFGGETMELVEMFVEYSWRNRGVGRALLDALIAHGRQRNIRRFSSQVHAGNAAIERALESCGFDPERRTVWSRQL